MSDELTAVIASWRAELKRALSCLETLLVQGESLAARLKGGQEGPIPLGGLVEIDRSHHRAPAALAAGLIGFLERGGRLEPDQAADLARVLTASRTRRAT